MHTALYIRVSTDAQYEEGYSVEAQKQKLEQYCKLKDITDYRFYIDGGWSGSNIERPEMKRMIDNIRSKQVSAVVVYKLDRLSRSQKDTVFLLEDVFIPNGCNFISLNENFDTTTPYGKAMIGILSVFAQLERENIRERTRMGMQERVKSGLWMGGGRVPFGYDYDPGKDVLIPNEHAKDVKQIYELYLQGYSTTQLAEMFDVSEDKQITDILTRVTYLGKIRFRGETYDARHEAIIDRELWDRVQREHERRSTRKAVHSSYLLTGLLYCGRCGAKMRYQKWGKDKVKIYCYSQQSSKKYLIRDSSCDNDKVDAKLVEKAVTEDLFRRTDSIVPGSDITPVSASALKILKQRYNDAAVKLKRLYNLYAGSGDELLLETIEYNKSELETIGRQIADEEKNHSIASDITERLNSVVNLREQWDRLSMKERQQAVAVCISRIVIDGTDIDIHYRF
ncbi:MAG TPA: recombinase family protein [Ruminococcaceae bacterium]|nr:recombinase family protein [Oscillospiraceae bacterium]